MINELMNDISVEEELDLNKTYNLPKEIRTIKYQNKYLAIYIKGTTWIVLNDDTELEIFNRIYNKHVTLEELFKKYDNDAVINVVMQIEAKKFDRPIVKYSGVKDICIYLTNNCNQRCRHCYMYAGDIKIDEVDYKKWIELLKRLKNIGYNGVTFTGGEVTIYPGYKEVIKSAHQLGLNVTVLSNGILWNSYNIAEMHEYIDEIQISVDGYDEKSYYDVRRYNGFKKAIDTVKLFDSYGTKVSIAVTPLYENLNEFIEKFKDFATDFMQKMPNVFVKLNHELITGREVNVSDEENQLYKNKLKKLVESLYPDYYAESFYLNYKDKTIHNNCGFGGLSIASNGDVYWCNRIHELKSSMNVFSDDLVSIDRMSEKIKESTSVDNTKICKDCEIKYICGGGCRMKYKGIQYASTMNDEWEYQCKDKARLLDKMVKFNEYFFEE